MSKFKLNLSDIEMDLIGSAIPAVLRHRKALDIDELSMFETLEKLYDRLKRIYRPDKKKYTVRLSSVEVYAFWKIVAHYLLHNGAVVMNLATPFLISLDNQIINELNIYNSRIG